MIKNLSIKFTQEEKTMENLNKVLEILGDDDTWSNIDKEEFIVSQNFILVYNEHLDEYLPWDGSLKNQALTFQEFLTEYDKVKTFKWANTYIENPKMKDLALILDKDELSPTEEYLCKEFNILTFHDDFIVNGHYRFQDDVIVPREIKVVNGKVVYADEVQKSAQPTADDISDYINSSLRAAEAKGSLGRSEILEIAQEAADIFFDHEDSSRTEQPDFISITDDEGNEYKFEKPDFECELFKIANIGNGVPESILGCVVNYLGNYQNVYFNLDGVCHEGKGIELEEYSLIPIKPNWYDQLDGTIKNGVWCKCWDLECGIFVCGKVILRHDNSSPNFSGFLGFEIDCGAKFMNAEPITDKAVLAYLEALDV